MVISYTTRDTTWSYCALYKGEKMRLVHKAGDEISCQRLDEQLGMLENGKSYLITVIPLDGKTVRDLQNKYFLLIDIVSAHAGEDKYIIHEQFKRHQNIDSTKNFDLEDWIKFIEAFKWKQFNDYDLIL